VLIAARPLVAAKKYTANREKSAGKNRPNNPPHEDLAVRLARMA
jgi:hypothetical protein